MQEERAKLNLILNFNDFYWLGEINEARRFGGDILARRKFKKKQNEKLLIEQELFQVRYICKQDVQELFFERHMVQSLRAIKVIAHDACNKVEMSTKAGSSQTRWNENQYVAKQFAILQSENCIFYVREYSKSVTI